MNAEKTPEPDPSTRAALEDLQGMIRHRYPAAHFSVARGDDPQGFYLKATVDLTDVDEIVDQELLDRLFDFQVEQGLPVYVVPLQPIDRVLVELQKRPERSLPSLPYLKDPVFTPRGAGSDLSDDDH